MKTRLLFSLLTCGTLCLVSATRGSESVALTFPERSGVSRSNEVVVFGVPIPRAWQVRNPAGLRLRSAEGPLVPGQFEVLARWGSHAADTNAPAQWVLVACPVSVPAHGTGALVCEQGSPGDPGPPSLTLATNAAGRLVVESGAAQFEINRQTFNLLDRVLVAGTPVITPSEATNALVYREMGGTNIVAATARRAPRPLTTEIERRGPLYAVVKVKGSILNDAREPVLDFTARYHFHAGRPEVRIDFTVENNHPVLAGEWDQPLNVHDLGSTNSVYVGNLQLALQLAASGQPLRVGFEQSVQVVSPGGPIRLDQDSSGLSGWDNYVGWVGWETNIACAPRLQSYCSRPGFTISGAGPLITGEQSLGWATVAREGVGGPRMQVVVRDFWQNFPKAIEARPDGVLSVDLFPNGQVFGHNLRVGEQKTHTLCFRFGLGAEPAGVAEERARALATPLCGQVSPQWYVTAGVLGEVPAQDLTRWPLYERYVRVAFEPNSDFDPAIHDPSFGNTTLRDTLALYNFYGWQDYGDVPLDYEAFGPRQAGQMNLKYWYVRGLWQQYCRSGDPRWLDLARPAAWHLADIDYLHIPDEGIQHWSHGAYFGHSEHDEPGNANPNRNYNSPSLDLFFGVPDLLLAYYLTGENRFREVALEGLEAMDNLRQFSDFTHPVIYRERANLGFAMLEGYRLTGDARWLADLREVVGGTANLSNKGWLADPVSYRIPDGWDWLSDFQLGQTLWTLGRYLDFCTEFGLADDLGVTNALRRYADFILQYETTEYAPGRVAARNAYYFYETTDQTDLEINNWALLMADVLAYAYKYSGQTNYLATAAKFYATGTIDPVWPDDPPVYLASKDLVNSLNWGLVYMSLSVPPPACTLRIRSHTPATTQLEWTSLGSAARYTLEYKNSLRDPTWLVVPGGQSVATNALADHHPGGAGRFWRVRLEP